MFCTKCGAQIPEDALFCHHCGNKTVINSPAAQPVAPVSPVYPMQQQYPAYGFAATNQNSIPVTKRKFWKYINIPFGILGAIFLAIGTFNFVAPFFGGFTSSHFAGFWRVSTPIPMASFNESCDDIAFFPDIVHSLKMNCITPAVMFFLALSLLIVAFAFIKNPIAKLCTMAGAVIMGVMTLAIVM